MKTFEEIIASIEEELEDLRKINNELWLENRGLKNQLAQANDSTVPFVSVDDAFGSIPTHLRDRSITTAYNAVKKHGYENICDLQGVKFCEWKGVGPYVAAVIALVLEHYGIKPEMPVSGIFKARYEKAKKYYYFFNS